MANIKRITNKGSKGKCCMRTYTIIGGVNGVGKSSFTGILKEQRSDLGIIIDVDKITAELGGNALEGGKAALKKINAQSRPLFRTSQSERNPQIQLRCLP